MNKSFTTRARALFHEHRNEEDAPIMERYMRHQFPFFGIKKPIRRDIGNQLFKEFGVPKVEEVPDYVRWCWTQPEREFQHFGNDILEKTSKHFPAEYIDLMEELVITKSWWDTVDTLAIRVIGGHFKRYPELIDPTAEKFVNHPNFWLNRVSIIFQLKYKQQTDVELLFGNILKLAHSKEFFIQKAIGWALREHSKLEGELVRTFIETEPLAPLSKREGLKWLKKQDLKQAI